MDVVTIKGITATGNHGVFDHERRDGQTFVVDVELVLDIAAAAATDDLAQTVNYGEVAADVVAVVQGEPRNLIETVAQQVADACLSYDRVQQVTVTLHKPEAPVGVPFEDVLITITRSR